MNIQGTQAEILNDLAEVATSYLEVGVQEGRSLAIVLAAGDKIRTVALLDDWGSESGGTGRGSHHHIHALLRDYPVANVTFYDGDSRTTLPSVPGEYDLVHIDGGHSYEVASSDLHHGWLRTRYFMVVHDISFHGVWSALFDFLNTHTGIEVACIYSGGHGTAVLHRTRKAVS